MTADQGSVPSLTPLVRQHETAWKLARYHLDGLSTDECLWRPGGIGPHVRATADVTWHADWPTEEGYHIGPPSIAWLTWHMGFWWSMVLNHSFGDAALVREDVLWPGDADAVRSWLDGLQSDWRGAIGSLTADDLAATERSRWPFRDRSFADVVAWVNLELTKNAAEIGYARFLYAVRR